jgi:hypothetical protein
MTLTAVALAMLGLGVIDLLLPEKSVWWKRTLVALGVTFAGTAALGSLEGIDIKMLLLHGGAYLAAFVAYAQLGRSEAWTGWKGTTVLVSYALLTSIVLLTPVSPQAPVRPFGAKLEASRLASAANIGADQLLVLLACAVLLGATSNQVVRIILKGTGAEWQGNRESLRGGRWIGPLERLLIFGFAAAGDLTGAALIASAKSLLRFPEISKGTRAEDGIHKLTEYFLVGSLSSWSIALYLATMFKIVVRAAQ